MLAGVCFACSIQLEVLDFNKATGLPLLNDMNGHAGILPLVKEGYEVIWA